ncbi:hypothetical protein [Streptomyces sp. NPDC048637]
MRGVLDGGPVGAYARLRPGRALECRGRADEAARQLRTAAAPGADGA